MYKNILIPSKGSGKCEDAIADGIELAKALNAKVTGVHVEPKLTVREILEVYHPEVLWGPKDAEKAQKAMTEVEEMHKAAADKVLSKIEKMAKDAGVPYEGVFIDREAPEDGILKIAERKGCDLIFMASHSTVGGLAGSILGGVTSKVVAHSKIPVLVHRCD